jgi:hypothetical protein
MISDKWADISDDVGNIYSIWRPTDLMALKRRWRHQELIKKKIILLEKLRNLIICYVFFSNTTLKARKGYQDIGILMADYVVSILLF